MRILRLRHLTINKYVQTTSIIHTYNLVDPLTIEITDDVQNANCRVIQKVSNQESFTDDSRGVFLPAQYEQLTMKATSEPHVLSLIGTCPDEATRKKRYEAKWLLS